MKKIFLYLLCLAGVVQFSSCNNILDVKPKGLQLESNYYKTPDQAFAALTAAYNPISWEAGGSDNTYIPLLGPLNSATDECYAGGGGPTDMSFWQVWNNYTLSGAVGPQAGFWDRSYTGIYRVNLLLQKIDGVEGLDSATKKRYIAEAKFLRGYYYFWLIRLFKNVPLITKPLTTDEIYNQVQASPDSVYAQIESDFRAAIPDLPSAPLPVTEQGRATKGAAEAYLGKTLLWEVGTGNDKTKLQEAADWFEKVNTDPAYHLLNNYADIFSPDNKFNAESIFEITHTQAQNAGWGNWSSFLGNVYTNMIGPRSYNGPKYWSGGWSFNPVTPILVDSMKNDPRYNYTIANIDSIVNAEPGRSYTKGYANTGYFIEKFAPLAKYVSTTGQQELNFPNDYIETRLAETYLLEAEALVRANGPNDAKAAQYLNDVRARVGLPPVAATLSNIYHEQLMELATEGHRWFNLVRTGRAAQVLAPFGFKAGVNEVLPIPLVELNNTKLKQNPGYN